MAAVIQKILAAIIDRHLRDTGSRDLLISVSKVRLSPDLLQAKIYLSIFPSEKKTAVFKDIRDAFPLFKQKLATEMRHDLYKLPELHYYLDDSLDYIEGIEKALHGDENPVKNPDLLTKRQKR